MEPHPCAVSSSCCAAADSMSEPQLLHQCSRSGSASEHLRSRFSRSCRSDASKQETKRTQLAVTPPHPPYAFDSRGSQRLTSLVTGLFRLKDGLGKHGTHGALQELMSRSVVQGQNPGVMLTWTTSASHFTKSPYPTVRCDSPGRYRVHGEQPAAVLLSFSRLHRHLFVDVTTPLQRPELTPVELHHGPNAARNNNGGVDANSRSSFKSVRRKHRADNSFRFRCTAGE